MINVNFAEFEIVSDSRLVNLTSESNLQFIILTQHSTNPSSSFHCSILQLIPSAWSVQPVVNSTQQIWRNKPQY